MLSLIKKLYSIFSQRNKKRIIYLFFGILVMGLVEVIVIASVMPFMMLVMDPAIVQKNSLLLWLYNYFTFSNIKEFLVFVGTGVFLGIVVGNLISAFVTWKTIRFSYDQGKYLSTKLFKHYLNNRYEFFIINNSSELTKNILHEINRLVTGLLLPIMQMCVKGVVSLFILTILIFIDPMLAIEIIVTLGGIYFFIFSLIKKKLGFWGVQSSILHAQRYKVISEAFDGIKELKIGNKQEYFVDLFSKSSDALVVIESKQQNTPQMYRYLLEGAAFGIIILIVLYLTSLNKNVNELIPLLALYTFSGYRLMPALQQIFSSLSLARYNASALEIVIKEFNDSKFFEAKNKHEIISRLKIVDFIKLSNICYAYPDSNVLALDNVSMKLKTNTLVAFVGKTGSGKSTLSYILSGLLEPLSGELIVDDIILDKNLRKSFQHSIGYVPQNIFLMDDTIAKNIAFGLDDSEIDYRAVERAAKLANIHDFIIDLPERYRSFVGEKGVRLSGGQRQRIGIARSLYHNPQLLIFDEATNALDTITEQSIINEIINLKNEMTVVMIAHRLATVRSCDNIYIFENGKVLAEGDYDTLLKTSSVFQKLNNEKGHSAC